MLILREIMVADTIALLVGFVLDLFFGDPAGKWHPVCLIGRRITKLEQGIRRRGEDSEKEERLKGGVMVVLILLMTAAATLAVLYGVSMLVCLIYEIVRVMGNADGWGVLVDSILLAGVSYLILAALLADSTIAARDLKKESMRVYDALGGSTLDRSDEKKSAEALPQGEQEVAEDLRLNGDGETAENLRIKEARKALSRIVGRDTEALDEAGVIRAAVETVAENTTDGVVAPLFYYMIGGPVLAMLYKAVNTMDSMLGYKNERYLHFGRAAAKLDDAANFLPSRLAALLWITAAAITGADAKGARRIWRRDRRKHESPNSAQTESACAGSLGILLAGDAVYFGKKKEKPTIGDAVREIEAEDIRRANKLMYATSFLMLLGVLLVRIVLIGLLYLQTK